MSQFEFLYALFGLLLGFILVEVLSGLTRTVRALSPSGRGEKSEIQIGWLTPLLGALTMLNVVVWWGNLWSLHNTLPVGFDTMIGGVILCSFYYSAASTIFPDEPRNWPEVNEWFCIHRRQVIGCLIAANIPFLLFTFTQGGTFVQQLVNGVANALFVTLLLLAMFAKREWMVTAALTILVVMHLSFVPLDHLHRNGIW